MLPVVSHPCLGAIPFERHALSRQTSNWVSALLAIKLIIPVIYL